MTRPRPSTAEKYGPLAEGYSERTYADPTRFHGRRADLVQHLGPRLDPGDQVLDLACADAAIAEHLLPRLVEYVGVDGNPMMVEAARRRVGDRARIELGDLNTYHPDGPVQATLCFNAIYYAVDRPQFFRLVASYTQKKFVFDLNPRQLSPTQVRAELRAAGLECTSMRPFFVPQRYALPRAATALLEVAERVPPLSRALLAFRFTYLCAAFRA